MKRHNYKNLKIWQAGVQFLYQAILLKDHQEQRNRFSHFIDIALGSSFELETQLIIAFKRNYITKDELTLIEEKIAEFQKMTMSFQN